MVPRPASGRVFETGRTVRIADADPTGRLRLDAVARYVHDVGNADVADAGLDPNIPWVVRRSVVEVAGWPQLGEQLAVSTWCGGTGSRWAEPDLDHAAAMMRRVYEKRDEAAVKARQARHDIVTRHTREATGAAATTRLKEIREALATGAAAQNRRVPHMQSEVNQSTPHAAILDSLESLTAQLRPTPQGSES